MKKLLVLTVLALSVLALSGQQASAWSKFKFGVGANISWTCSGNSLLWGAYQTSPLPGGGDPYGYPGPIGYGDPGYSGGPGYYGDNAAMNNQTGPAPAVQDPAAGQKIKPVDYQNYWYGQNGYQPVGYYQAPSYWYGN
jgi:hypothetical protein